MNKTVTVLAAALFSVSSLFAMGGMGKMFQSVSQEKAQIMQKGESKMYCPNCGMYLPKFYKTSHAAKLKNGEVRQYCSIYCLTEEMELTTLRGKKDRVEQIMVVDVPSLQYIDAKKAYYVVGSKKKGTMTANSKYAFAQKEAAEQFAAQNGGAITDFDGAYAAALDDFARDTAMVYKKRSSKMYKMGKKLYNTKCDKAAIKRLDAHTMGDMKAMIKTSKACGENLNDMQLQGIMLYWWDVKLDKFEKLYGKNKEVQKYINK